MNDCEAIGHNLYPIQEMIDICFTHDKKGLLGL